MLCFFIDSTTRGCIMPSSTIQKWLTKDETKLDQNIESMLSDCSALPSHCPSKNSGSELNKKRGTLTFHPHPPTQPHTWLWYGPAQPGVTRSLPLHLFVGVCWPGPCPFCPCSQRSWRRSTPTPSGWRVSRRPDPAASVSKPSSTTHSSAEVSWVNHPHTYTRPSQ